jgi:alanine dehydrogenase
MVIGVPRERTREEYRVAVSPDNLPEIVYAGHKLLVETNAGEGLDISDGEYEAHGAEIVATLDELYSRADIICKVKEPQPEEIELFREGLVIFSFFHLAACPEIADTLVRSRAVGIAFETVTDHNGGLPILWPMSEIAGRLSVQEGAKYLERPAGGRGVLLSGASGVDRCRVTVLGGGVSGTEASRIAALMGADVTVLEINPERIRKLEELLPANATPIFSSRSNIERCVTGADLVIGAVLVPGARAPRLVTREMISRMKRGAVVVDIAIDQGGCFETSRPTTHSDPTYVVDDVIHYCVTNMPGAVPHTSAPALSHAVVPYLLKLAGLGWKRATDEHPGLKTGLNVAEGRIVHPAVAAALGESPANT